MVKLTSQLIYTLGKRTKIAASGGLNVIVVGSNQWWSV